MQNIGSTVYKSISSFPRRRANLKDAVAAKDLLRAKLSSVTTLADIIKDADAGDEDTFKKDEVVSIFAETINKFTSEAITFVC